MDDYFDKGFLLVLADVLSLITISSCLVCKIPQIRTINARQSAVGISIVSLLMELSSYTTTMSYNFCKGYAYLSYLEYPLLIAQEYVLIYSVLRYNNWLNGRSYLWAAVYFVITGLFLTRVIPSVVLTFMVPFCTPVGATSKIMQLIAIIRSKDSSAVSQTTWAISAFTNFTRIYTIMVESADMVLLTNFGISFLLSSSVLAAAIFYQKKDDYKKMK